MSRLARTGMAYLRRHHVALLALFVALSGTAYAAVRLPPGSVGTRELRSRAVTLKKISPAARRALHGAKGQDGAPGRDGAAGKDGAPGKTGATGRDGVPGKDGTGATIAGVVAGGDLTGTYPSPSLKPNAVNGATVADQSLTGDDVKASTMGKVPNAADADTVGGTAPAQLQLGGGRTTTTSGTVNTGVGATAGAIFVDANTILQLLCEDNFQGTTAAQLTLSADTGIKAWVSAATANSTYAGIHKYEFGHNDQTVAESGGPQLVTIQANTPTGPITMIVSTDLTLTGGGAACEWSATVTQATH